MTEQRTFGIARPWHAGETGCGVLIVGIKREIARIEAGELLEVTALDAGASVDIPAWCRMTGHRLVVANHPTYVIARKGG